VSTILRTLLSEWIERKLPTVIERDVRVEISQPAGINLATVITGFRRVGKTYLLFGTIEKLLEVRSRAEVVYINFEDERILTPSTDLLTDLIPEIQALYGRKPDYLFLDELQIIPNWSKWVRRILDTENIRLFITGSSSKMSSREIPTELRGRAWEVRVNPLTFHEFLRFKQVKIDIEKLTFVKDELARFRFVFDEFLTFGSLPAVVLTPAEKKMELLQTYFQTVVQRDIAERYKIGNEVALKTLLKVLLNSNTITISKLHNTLKSLGLAVGKTTIDHYLAYIESSYFMDELFIYTPSVKNRGQYPRKVYFVDGGLITALSTKFSKNWGRLFENLAYHKLSNENSSLYYYKDASGYEVDFVAFSNGETSALFQVCFDLSDEDTLAREIKGLIKTGSDLHCENLSLITMLQPDHLKIPSGIKVQNAWEFF
jgi:uncharacterized protein